MRYTISRGSAHSSFSLDVGVATTPIPHLNPISPYTTAIKHDVLTKDHAVFSTLHACEMSHTYLYFLDVEHHCTLVSTKLYCLLAEAYECNNLTRIATP